MFNVNLYMRVDLNEEDRERLLTAKATLIDLRDSVMKCSDMAIPEFAAFEETLNTIDHILYGKVLG